MLPIWKNLKLFLPHSLKVSWAEEFLHRIADTFYLQGKIDEAAEFFGQLMKLDLSELNKTRIQFKLIRWLTALGRDGEMSTQAGDFLTRYPAVAEQSEVRFLLANSLKQFGRKEDALQQVQLLLNSHVNDATPSAKTRAYWQQWAGHEIANQLYLEGNYVHALEIYLRFVSLDSSPSWQFPVLYQVGLVYERLQQPAKAVEAYTRILTGQKGLDSNTSPGLKTVLDMAQWHREFLNWQTKPELSGQTNAHLNVAPPPQLPHA